MILPADITDIQDGIAQLIVETLLYGIQLILYITTIYFLATRRTLASGNVSVKHHFLSLPFCGGSILFLSSSLHWIMEIYAMHTAVAHLADEPHDNFLLTPPETAAILEGVSLAVSFFLGDCLVVYRLWIIWAKGRRIIIFPVGCLIGVLAVFAGMLYLVIRSTVKNPDGFIFSNSANSPAKLFLVFAFVFSLLLWLVLSAVTILSGAHAAFIMPVTYPAILSISNLLIHARVGLGWSPEARPVSQFECDSEGRVAVGGIYLGSVPFVVYTVFREYTKESCGLEQICFQ
ncbi:hypothetical protein R3P38DRAFT_3309936 [Favolaschia claudopus]|uniref:Uncharacterized protein n=1 Tax=Favolaschia claudopus TaxID=2862362 RepID=A0AAW0CXB7_9AGAR